MTYVEEMEALLRSHLAAVVALLNKHPEHREQTAYEVLGAAVAVADSMGVDADGFVAQLRQRYRKPPVLSPPATTEKGGER